MPSVRQFLLLGLLWALTAWLTTAAWGMLSQHYGPAEALTAYYAVRAPIVGALAGIVGAPILCAGMLRFDGVPRPERRLLRKVQGAAVGQLVGTAATVALLFFWPNDLQNTRMDAFKWGGVFWRVYWWLFVPASAVAGALSVSIALRTGRRPFQEP